MDYNFFDNVYDVVRLIPKGRVSTYGAIAKYLGAARSARMVGWAMNQCGGLTPPVPAHRVVNRIGVLSGKAAFSSDTEMADRLKAEGVDVRDDQVINFENHFWDPNLELDIE